MVTPPDLIDRAALLRNRARAKPDAMFLHKEAVIEVQDRLSMVNKAFTHPAIVSGFSDQWDVLRDAKHLSDEPTLDLEPSAHDVIVHGFALHWANDPVGQLIQMRRALRPDGLMLGICLGGQTLHELRACLSEAEIALRGGLSPRVLPMGDIRDLGALLQRAGFALPVIDSVPLTVEYDHMLALMQDLRAMGENNALAARERVGLSRKVLSRAGKLYEQHYPGDQKPIRATFELMVLTGWAPSADQPQPLRPGSATTRLADALRTTETKLSD